MYQTDKNFPPVVRSVNGVFGTCKNPMNPALWKPEDQIPVYFSANDLLWSNDFPQLRFGQGCFQESMAAIYQKTTGLELQRYVRFRFIWIMCLPSTICRIVGGKPSRATYEYASNRLHSNIDALAHEAATELKTPIPRGRV